MCVANCNPVIAGSGDGFPMDGADLSAALVESANEVYQYITDMQFATDPPLGMSVSDVISYVVGEGYAVLHLEGQVPDTCGLMLMVGDRVLQDSDAGFDRYDEVSRTIVVRPGADVLEDMAEKSPKVRLISDMRFLISTVGEFYRRYGGFLTMPLSDPVASAPVYPEGSEPSRGQRDAVANVLTHRTSYVWGAPGTGKTQFVLAACIRACMAAGRKVAVFAPTNNSVEQVLRGVMKAVPPDDPMWEGTIRLGVPTKSFFRDHPEMCEDRQAQRRIAECERVLDCLGEVLYERSCDDLLHDFESLRSAAFSAEEDPEGNVMLRDHADLRGSFQDMLPFLAMRPATRDLALEASRRDFRSVIGDLFDAVYRRQRPAADIEEYEGWSDADLMSAMMETESEMKALMSRTTGVRLERAVLIAATPHQFISRFRPKGSEEDGRPELDVDHIFLDEAGYCGLMQAASLFTNGVPVTFLGDHMQLPPVSQLDDEVLRSAAERGGRLKLGFLWNMSSLHCETLITEGPGVLSAIYLSDGEPVLRSTPRSDLTESHRFGRNLARVLDSLVYMNGLSGSPDGGDLEIVCIDAVCTSREGRDNRAEAEAVREFLRREKPDPGDVAVLTPYSVQLSVIKRMVGRRYRDSVMTVHGSQGREWDAVVLSVADNGIESREVPLRFTSSQTPIGKKVINTAVSRAKRRLVIVCDRDFWMSRQEELIGGILREVRPEDVEVFNRRCPDAS